MDIWKGRTYKYEAIGHQEKRFIPSARHFFQPVEVEYPLKGTKVNQDTGKWNVLVCRLFKLYPYRCITKSPPVRLG